MYEKYFVVQASADVDVDSFDSIDYDTYSVDANGDAMRGYPLGGSVKKISFCLAPGEYTLHAIDDAGHGWWNNAYYSVLVNGAHVIDEKMGSTSVSRQTTSFMVTSPSSARTAFSENKASTGGGGALFWYDASPENVETYRSDSDSNTAVYGDFIATPGRSLSSTSSSYDTTSGDSMTADPVTVQITDRYGFLIAILFCDW